MTAREINEFQKKIYRGGAAAFRVFPWRQTRDPYCILVSEMMLQQTQASRVAPTFETFIERFPTLVVLARAPLSEVLRYWSGLGYNRRAKFLWLTARCIVTKCGGSVPASLEKLKALPGIGSYSAAAILVFAYDKPAAVLETNIRSVFLHYFFPRQEM